MLTWKDSVFALRVCRVVSFLISFALICQIDFCIYDLLDLRMLDFLVIYRKSTSRNQVWKVLLLLLL